MRMNYRNIVKGIFLSRPNRFIAYVAVEGVTEKCHVKNTGRCKELLIEGATVLLEKARENAPRKTKYDLVAVYKDERLINIDSMAPNAVAKDYLSVLFGKDATVLPEKTFQSARFDFLVTKGERRVFVEVKGVTLENGGTVRFPDAPTERGRKHLIELCRAVEQGYEAMILFVIQMEGAVGFLPNDDTDPAFGWALRYAREAGVKVAAISCRVFEDGLEADGEIPLLF